MTTSALSRPAMRTITFDALLCACVALVPALSHAVAYPLYVLDPTRMLVYAALLCSSRRNALLMALWLPLVSTLTSGHPLFPKFILIQAELALNVVVYDVVLRSSRRFTVAAAVSVLASKAFYYAVKFALVAMALLDGRVVSTPWVYQEAAFGIVLVGGGLISGVRGRRARGIASRGCEAP